MKTATRGTRPAVGAVFWLARRAALALILLPGAWAWAAGVDSTRQDERDRLVRTQLVTRGVVDEDVLEVMARVPRHRFVPAAMQPYAYADNPLPIAAGQTISQPYIVAFMTQALELEPADRVLEVGTGSGYQAAVLAELVDSVWTIEIVPSLGDSARALLERLGYDNVSVRVGDGYQGWPEAQPFDAIIVTAAPDHVPPALLAQLAMGGRLVIPVGPQGQVQALERLRRREDGIETETLLPVRFVPMTGEAQRRRSRSQPPSGNE